MGIPQNALDYRYPRSPPFSSLCPVNEVYQTLPASSINPSSSPVQWETVAYGPTSVKHIYSGIPNWYPFQTISRPVNTLYGHDFSQYFDQGSSAKGKRSGYTYKPYPFTNINNKEVRIYADYTLPYMNTEELTKHPIIRGDASINSPLQKYPFPYYNDTKKS
jgi:hypothetical protein